MSDSETTPVESAAAPIEESASERAPQAAPAAAKPIPVTKSAAGDEPARGEVSAATIGRLMGLATASELKLLEGKIDLMSSKINTMMVRVDRLTALFSSMPTGADLERVDVQIGALKALIRDTLTALAGKEPASETAAKKPGANIVSNETKEGDAAAPTK